MFGTFPPKTPNVFDFLGKRHCDGDTNLKQQGCGHAFFWQAPACYRTMGSPWPGTVALLPPTMLYWLRISLPDIRHKLVITRKHSGDAIQDQHQACVHNNSLHLCCIEQSWAYKFCPSLDSWWTANRKASLLWTCLAFFLSAASGDDNATPLCVEEEEESGDRSIACWNSNLRLSTTECRASPVAQQPWRVVGKIASDLSSTKPDLFVAHFFVFSATVAGATVVVGGRAAARMGGG